MIFSDEERLTFESCPPEHGGVHDWSFEVLKVLARRYTCDLALWQATRIICDRFATRIVDDGEIRRQIANARRFTWTGSGCKRLALGTSESKWPLADNAKIEKIVRTGLSVLQLGAKSPVLTSQFATDNRKLLNMLFPGNPLLCCSKFINSHETRPLDRWGSLDDYQFIVPSPMSKVWGETKDDRPSQRCNDNTGPRRFLVVEFDFEAASESDSCQENVRRHRSMDKQVNALETGRLVARLNRDGFTVHDMCAALIGHLTEYLPPVLVVNSGGKSLHSWFSCAGIKEDVVRQFMHYAVHLGGDPHTWTCSQFVRMPGGLRENGARQEIIYFNPEALL